MNRHPDTPRPNPGSSYSRHRLADISHLYLSDEAERLSQWHNTLIMPVMLVSKNDDYLVYQLEQAMKRHDRSCLVLNIENQLGPEALAAKHARNADAAQASAPNVCLIPLTATSTIPVLKTNRLLLAVPASLPGVRLAYNHLATLASFDLDLTVHVVMLEADSQEDAQRYFKFLSNSARNFLAVDIQYSGFLLRDGAQLHTANADAAPAIPHGMDEIAETLLRSRTPQPGKPRPPTLGRKAASPALNLL
jgi:hypothetical protein